MKKTALHPEHLALKGKMVNFADFEMPVSYGPIKDEYYAVRQATGLFDISHMAPIYFSGSKDDIVALLNFVTCKEISEINQGQVQYNALINNNGGIVDDITVYYIEDDLFAIIANASNRQKVVTYLEETIDNNKSAVVMSAVENYILLALQGPKSAEILEKVFSKHGITMPELFYYECSPLAFTDFKGLLSRTGYTGEDGFEILLPIIEGKQFWQDFIDATVTPCGLAARDILRLEMFYPLYGNELNESDTPIQSGMSWLVSKEKNYAGKEKVEASRDSLEFRVRGFIFHDDGIPRSHYKVFSEAGDEIGEVTSGGFSFTWGKGFGMARLKQDFTKKGSEIYIDIRGKKKKAEVLAKSKYTGSIKRQ